MFFDALDRTIDLEVEVGYDIATCADGPDDSPRPHGIPNLHARGIEMPVNREESLAVVTVLDHHVEPKDGVPTDCVHPAAGDAAHRSALGELQIHTRVLARVLPGIEVVGPHVAGRVVELGSDLWNPPWLDELRERKCEHCEIVGRNGDELRIGNLTICPIPFLWRAHRSPVRHSLDRMHCSYEGRKIQSRLMYDSAAFQASLDVREEWGRAGIQGEERKRNAGPHEDGCAPPPENRLESDKELMFVH